jgi:ribosome-associated protein
MPAPIHVTPTVVVPARALTLRMVRSSGPGGQNVNKVASKVELRASRRRDADGRLLVTSQKTRDQGRNLEDARNKVAAMVAGSLRAPKPRRPTYGTRAARERRLAQKKRAGARKRERRAVGGETD